MRTVGDTDAEVRPPPTSPPTTADAVVVIHWPDDAALRASLAGDQVRRLLVLDEDGEPPLAWDDNEDWIRSGADAVEVAARLDRLATTPAVPAGIVIDADGLVHAPDGRWATVPPVEARLLAALLNRKGRAVDREALRRATWGRADVALRAVDSRIRLLRPRVAPLGLTIHTVRGVGYLLDDTRAGSG